MRLSAHPIVILLPDLAQFTFEVDLYLEIEITVVPRVLAHRECAGDLLELFDLQ